MQYRRVNQSGGTYFFTLVTHHREPIFNNPTAVTLLKEAIRSVKTQHAFSIDAFVLLPNHLHCIWTLPEGDADNSTRWMLIKGHFTRHYAALHTLSASSASRIQKRERTVWQRRFWAHWIQDENDYIKHVEYIHFNPVKHGFVSAPKDWRHSSFHRYVKQGIYDIHWSTSLENMLNDIGSE